MTARVTVLVEAEDGAVERWRAELVELGYDDNLSTLVVHGQAWERDHPAPVRQPDGADPRSALRCLAGHTTPMHDHCHERAAVLASLLAECRDEIDRLDRLGPRRTDDLLRRIDAATEESR